MLDNLKRVKLKYESLVKNIAEKISISSVINEKDLLSAPLRNIEMKCKKNFSWINKDTKGGKAPIPEQTKQKNPIELTKTKNRSKSVNNDIAPPINQASKNLR